MWIGGGVCPSGGQLRQYSATGAPQSQWVSAALVPGTHTVTFRHAYGLYANINAIIVSATGLVTASLREGGP